MANGGWEMASEEADRDMVGAVRERLKAKG
jgi:hypothetical protein